MSTATTPPPAVAKPPRPADYIRTLSPEDKQILLVELLREAVAWNGESALLPVEDADGRPFGYFVPPKVAEEQYAKLVAEMPPGVRNSMTRLMPAGYDPDDCLGDEELAAIRAEVSRRHGG